MTKTIDKLEIFNGGRVINMTDTHILTHSQNTWDMNYHLYLVEKRGKDEYHPIMSMNSAYRYNVKKELLIDSDEVVDNYDDMEEYGGMITWEEFSKLQDTDFIESIAWKEK